VLHEAHTTGVFGDLECPTVNMRIKAVKNAVTDQFQLVLVLVIISAGMSKSARFSGVRDN
jgi:hypothetical protein